MVTKHVSIEEIKMVAFTCPPLLTGDRILVIGRHIILTEIIVDDVDGNDRQTSELESFNGHFYFLLRKLFVGENIF